MRVNRFFCSLLLVFVFSAVWAEDLSWRYEGEWAAPAVSEETSAVSSDVTFGLNVVSLSPLFGAVLPEAFTAFAFSVQADAQETEFYSTQASGLRLILR